MAGTAQLLPATTSFIENLPAELLETILLEAVDDIKPPIYHTEKGDKRFRWYEQCVEDQPTACDFLQIRLWKGHWRDSLRCWFQRQRLQPARCCRSV